MKLICKQVEKSRTFGSEDAHGTIHYIVSCQFAKQVVGSSRFLRSALGGSLYQKSFDLETYFPQEIGEEEKELFEGYEPSVYWVENKRTHQVEFDSERAFEDFRAENLGVSFDGLNAWDIPMHEASKGETDAVETSDGNLWSTMYVAEMEDVSREDVVKSCQRSYARMLESGVISIPTDQSNSEK